MPLRGVEDRLDREAGPLESCSGRGAGVRLRAQVGVVREYTAHRPTANLAA
jgi:hypothetical protein